MAYAAIPLGHYTRLMRGQEPGNTDDYILQCVEVTPTSPATAAAIVCNHTAKASLDVKTPVCAISAQIRAKDSTGATAGLYYVAVTNDTTYGPGAIVNCTDMTADGVYEVWILGIPYSTVTG
jgi:hypothetical protein